MYGSLRSVASELPKSTAKRQGRGGVREREFFFSRFKRLQTNTALSFNAF
jgi:hypothetical protein